MSFNRCAHCLRVEWRGGPCERCGYDGVPRNPFPMLPEGTRVGGRYMLGRTEGRGGFSICYRAWDEEAGEIVAIKELFPLEVAFRRPDGRVGVASGYRDGFRTAVAAFEHEAEVLRLFADEPAIVHVKNAFRAHDTAYLVMEFLRGVAYDQYLEKRFAPKGEHLDEQTAVEVVLTIVGALDAVHEKGLYHLDIKPKNVRVVEDGDVVRVVLLDFGSAREAFRTDAAFEGNFYSVGYAGPEQHLDTQDVTAATDVYGAAALLYFSLSLEAPTSAKDRAEGVSMEPLRSLNADVSAGLNAVVEKALSLDPNDRYATAYDFRQALEPYGPGRGSRRKSPQTSWPSASQRLAAGLIDIGLASLAGLVTLLAGGDPSAMLGVFILAWWGIQLTPALEFRATPGMAIMGEELHGAKPEDLQLQALLPRTVMLLGTVLRFRFKTDPEGLMEHDRTSKTHPLRKGRAVA